MLTENSFGYGIRSRLLGNLDVFEKKLNYTIGGEFFRDNYKSRTFENLYEDFPPQTGSVQGEKLSDFKEDRMYYNIFLETDYSFSDRTTFSLGLNLNQTSYELSDRFPVSNLPDGETAENQDQSGDYKFKTILSPKFGLSHLISEGISLFTSVSHGFSPISLNETLLPNGQINTDLKPETGWNYEIGSRGQILSNRLQYSVLVYRLAINNLVVSRRTAQDQFIGINAGSTRHDGLELSLDYMLFKNEPFKLNPFFNYTLNRFKFEEFIDDTNNFSGNDLTGVPDQILNLGFDFTSEIGIYGNINHQYVGAMPITDDNALYSDAYNLTNLKIGYSNLIANKLNLDVYFGLNNIFDADYAAQILINASGFGGAAPRYYYPGNPINYYTGLRLNYEL